VADVLKKKLPESSSIMRFASRVKGGGSLGRPRYIAIAHWPGGRIVREAKALVPQVPSLGVDGRCPSRYALYRARTLSIEPARYLAGFQQNVMHVQLTVLTLSRNCWAISLVERRLQISLSTVRERSHGALLGKQKPGLA
jgi:hypothetical protein